MTYFKRLGLAIVLSLSGLIAYSWLFGVTDGDIYAYHDVDFRTGDRKMPPGSIAAVSANGNISEICSLKTDGLPQAKVRTALYYNVLREDFPAYVKSIKAFAWLLGSAEAAPSQDVVLDDPDGLPRNGRKFVGSENVIQDLSLADDFVGGKACEESMAWHLSRGYKACTVRKSLNAAVFDDSGAIQIRTVAVAFAEHSNFVGERTFKDFDVPYNTLAREANGKPCDGGSLPWTARVRRSLEIIDRVYVPA